MTRRKPHKLKTSGYNTFAACHLNVDCCKSFTFITIFYFCCFRCVIMPLTGMINYVFGIYHILRTTAGIVDFRQVRRRFLF